MSNSKTTVEEVEASLRRNRGILNATAADLKITRGALYSRIQNNEHLQDVLKECRDIFVDTAEVKLIEAVDQGAQWAITTVLKTLGKDRGYVERQEMTGKGGAPLQVNQVTVDLSKLTIEELEQYEALSAKVIIDTEGVTKP